MTTYYISKSGNDSADGQSEANAWLTVTKAAATLAAGDTVYIAPGTYREKISCTNAGSSGSLISYIGDPDCEHFTGQSPGIVRITGCGTDELPTSGNIFDKNAKAYVYLKNLTIDGGSGNYYAVKCPTSNDGGNEKVYAQHDINGFNYGVNIKCVALAGNYGFNYGTNTNCFSIGGTYSFYVGTNTGCIGISGNRCFNFGNNINCLALAGNYGFNAGTPQNCICIGGYYCFFNSPAVNCLSVSGYYGFASGTLYGCRASGCNSASYSTSGDAVAVAPITLFDFTRIMELARIFEPILAPALAQLGKSDASAGTTDILGRPRNMLGDTLDIGPWALSDMIASFTSGDYNTTAPGIVITNEGQQEFEIVADGGVAITVACQAKHVGTSTGAYPQLILRGDSITEQTDTHSSTSGAFEALSVTATPSKDDVLKAIFYARDPGTAATVSMCSTGTNTGLDYTAKSKGTFGNDITITYTGSTAASVALGSSVVGHAINFILATSTGGSVTTTATQLKSFLEASTSAAFANVLISAANSTGSDGSGVLYASTATMSGGLDPVAYFSDLAIS